MRNFALGFLIALLLLGIPLFFTIDPLFEVVIFAVGGTASAFYRFSAFAAPLERQFSRGPPFSSEI